MKAEWNCGGVVAYLAGGRVENCVNRMNITPRSESIYLYYVGGVVGYMTNYTDNSAVIIGCRNEGSIDGGTTGENVGGVVGGASNSPGIRQDYWCFLEDRRHRRIFEQQGHELL